MEMKQCPSGHYYDAAIHPQCPYCSAPHVDIGATVAVDRGGTAVPGATVAVIKKKMGIDPVVGWLVCVEGAERGRDYRLHADNNFVGRDKSMDVCIEGDDTISREKHAVITCDLDTLSFYLTPKDGRSNPHLNGKPVFSTVELSPYDRIRLGQTTLLFLPFCGERFSWQ